MVRTQRSTHRYNMSSTIEKYDLTEFFPNMVYNIFVEKPYNSLPVKYQYLSFIQSSYNIVRYKPEYKHKMYNLLKTISKEKAFEMLENKGCAAAFNMVLHHYNLWNGNVYEWKKPSRNPYKQIESLISHLFCKYKVPKFLFKVFYDFSNTSLYTNLGFKWFLHLGNGKSARELPGIEFGLTKKIAHYLINAPETLTIRQAVIYAISKNAGASPRLQRYLYARVLEENILSTLRTTRKGFPDDYFEQKFWVSVIEYFCKQGMFDYEIIDHLLDYIKHIKFGNRNNGEKPDFEIKRKSLQTLINDAEKWTDQMNRMAIAARREMGNIPGLPRRSTTNTTQTLNYKWEGMGIRPYQFSKKGKERRDFTYTINEILNGKDLLEEGRIMRHCVFSYAGSCMSKKCSIFSLKDNINGSLVTLEVTRSDKKLVQAKSKGNRPPTSEEITIIKNWASINNIQLSEYLRF